MSVISSKLYTRMVVSVWLGLSFNVILDSCYGNGNEEFLQKDEDFSVSSHPPPNMPSFGTLHTLDKLVHWSGKEEVIYSALHKKKRLIIKEYDLLNKFLGCFKVFNSKKRSCKFFQFHFRKFIGDLNSFISNVKNEQNINLNIKRTLQLEMRKVPNVNSDWPDSADLYVSQVAILLIHEYSSKMISQLIQTSKFSEYLKAFDSALIGLHALSRKLLYFGIEWLDFSLRMLSRKSKKSTHHFPWNEDSCNIVELILKIAIQIHNQQLLRKDDDVHTLLDMYTGPARLSIEHVPEYSGRISLTKKFGGNYGNHSSPLFSMLAICSGARFQPEYIKSGLMCYLDRTKDPYFVLNPLKTEQLSVHPNVLQFYDILGPEIIAKLYDSREEVVLSPVIAGTDKSKILLARSATGSFSRDEVALEKVRVKGEMMTGMILRKELMASKAKLMEYTYGRHYAVHRDLVSQRESRKNPVCGDPVVTLLYYVETPISGGDTPFSSLGIAANPVKGSAVMWINMFRNGTIRDDVFHGSCPVTMGRKLDFPNEKLEGFDLPRREWKILNRFRSGHGCCNEQMHRWNFRESPQCDCDNEVNQSMNHILNYCPSRRFEHGLDSLHQVTPEGIEWIRNLDIEI